MHRGGSATTVGNNGHHGYPADQLLRNIRVGLSECSWFGGDQLFDLVPRDCVVILWSPTKGHDLVRKYRDPDQLRASIPHSDRLIGLPTLPFVGELSYGDVVDVLRRQQCRFTCPERQLIDSLTDYLGFKLATLSKGPESKQTEMDFPE